MSKNENDWKILALSMAQEIIYLNNDGHIGSTVGRQLINLAKHCTEKAKFEAKSSSN